MMRATLLVLTVLSAAILVSPTPVAGQDTNRDYAAECGDAKDYSDSYIVEPRLTGLAVSEVVDGRTIKVVTQKGVTLVIRIAGLDVAGLTEQQRARSAAYLTNLLNQHSVVAMPLGYARGTLARSRELETSVRLGSFTGIDVGLAMVEAGMADYQESLHLGSYNRCVYRSGVTAARAARRGLWADAWRETQSN